MSKYTQKAQKNFKNTNTNDKFLYSVKSNIYTSIM